MYSVHPGIPLEPAYKGVRSQLVDGYFTSIFVTRGHAYGLLTFPSGETWSLHDVASVKHAYAMEPVQNLVSSYIRGTVFVVGTSLNWFRAHSAKSELSWEVCYTVSIFQRGTSSYLQSLSLEPKKTVDSSQLVIGVNDLDFSTFNVKYEATDNRSIYNMTTAGLNTTFVFAGCAASQQNPYEFTAFPVVSRGGFVDSAGGTTVYYNINASSSIWLDHLAVGDGTDSLGILEVYTSHKHSHSG